MHYTTRIAVVTLAATGLACAAGEPPDVEVMVVGASEDCRTLPVKASGATTLLGIELADSQCVQTYDVEIENAPSVQVSAIRYAVTLDGAEFDHDLRRLAQDGRTVESGQDLDHGVPLDVWFSHASLDDFVFPEGVPYHVALELDWHDDRYLNGDSGTTTVDLDGYVSATAETGSFAPLEPVDVEAPGLTGAQLWMDAEVTSGLEVDVQAASAVVTYFGEPGLVPALGLALYDDLARRVGEEAAGTVAPGETLSLYSSGDPEGEAAYEEAGTAATTAEVGGGLALVTVTVDYEILDGTGGVEQDVLYAVAEVP